MSQLNLPCVCVVFLTGRFSFRRPSKAVWASLRFRVVIPKRNSWRLLSWSSEVAKLPLCVLRCFLSFGFFHNRSRSAPFKKTPQFLVSPELYTLDEEKINRRFRAYVKAKYFKDPYVAFTNRERNTTLMNSFLVAVVNNQTWNSKSIAPKDKSDKFHHGKFDEFERHFSGRYGALKSFLK